MLTRSAGFLAITIGGLVLSSAASLAHASVEPMSLQQIASGLTRPVYVTAAPGDDDRLFIVEQRVGSTGRVRIYDRTTESLLSTPFLSVPGVSTASEQGLLGLVFHPDYQDNGYFYINFTASNGATVVRRYEVSDDPNIADPDSAQTVITFSQPASNHNGGWIDFGPDGYMYIGTGDGGSGGDPWNNAQNLNTLLGKMLRIDVNGDDFPNDNNRNYAIPRDNPFVGTTGMDEIWAYGLRNPWRNSFDRETGDLWIGDVGQNQWEEVNFQPADSPGGENYGWRCYEGNQPFNLTGCPPKEELVFPVYVYPISGQPECAIIGGFIYRGSAIPSLYGRYVFADYCSAKIWSFEFDGEAISDLQNHTGDLNTSWISSFGEDNDGEIYVMNLFGGTVHRVVSDAPPVPDNNDCENAIAVTEGITEFSTIGATTTGPAEPDDCEFFGDTNIQNDIWFTYEATDSGDLTIALCESGYPAKLGVYGATCPETSGTVIACDLLSCPEANRPILTLPVSKGELFHIRIGGHNGNTGEGVLEISLEPTDPTDCPGDLTGSGNVGVPDLLVLINNWGTCDDPDDCPADLTGDGSVGVPDLLELIGQWGPCPN